MRAEVVAQQIAPLVEILVGPQDMLHFSNVVGQTLAELEPLLFPAAAFLDAIHLDVDWFPVAFPKEAVFETRCDWRFHKVLTGLPFGIP
jgi:hypothetical protein